MQGIANTARRNGAVAAIAERQHGLISRRQLRSLGLSDKMIDDRATAGLVHPIFRGAYAVGHRAIGRRGRMLAAVLACGEGTVVSHRSAAELLGLWDKRPVLVDVISGTQAGRKIQGVRWHRVPQPEAWEVTSVEGIPCTTVSRTLVDIAGSVGRVTLCRLVEQAAVLRRLDVLEVERVLDPRRRRGATRLRAILSPWRTADGRTPRLRSLLEARFVPALARAGLPTPQFNVILDIDGHRLEVDLLWAERQLVIETDGEETHGTRAAFQHDRWRDQILVGAGYSTARVTWHQLEHEPAETLARIRRMLEAR